MTTQKLIRKVNFPIYGNFCLIHALKGLGIDVQTNMDKGHAIALFDCSDLETCKTYECVKSILTRRYAATASA